MKISASDLNAAVSACAPFADRGAVPILKTIRIVAERGECEFVATNTNQTIIRRTACVGDIAFCIDAETLAQKTRLLKSGDVTIECDGRDATVSQGRSRWKMPVLPVMDFPGQVAEPVNTDPIVLPGTFADDMKTAVAFAETNTSRQNLLGVHCDGPNLIATDGKKFVVIEAGGTMPSITIPSAVAGKLSGLTEMRATEARASFSNKDTVILTKLVEGRYPEWQAIIAKQSEGFDGEFNVDRDGFIACLERAAAIRQMGEKTGSFINMQIRIRDGEIEAYASNRTEGDEASDFISCERNGPNHDVGFNGANLIMAVKSLNYDTIRVQYGAANSPFIMSPLNGKRTDLRMVLPRMFT